MKEGDTWRVTAAGPTTSIREEPYQGEIIKRYGVRAVIGKGGMGAKTLAALKEHGAVYLNAIGGAAQFYARAIERVDGVSLLEFGTPEAMWHLTVKDFPGDRHDGRARQQPAQGHRAGIRRSTSKRSASDTDHDTTTINAESAEHAELFSNVFSAISRPLRSPSCRELLERRAAVAVLHRRQVEIHRLHVDDRDQRKRRKRGDVDRFQVTLAGAADFDAAILSFFVRRRRDERFAVSPQ